MKALIYKIHPLLDSFDKAGALVFGAARGSAEESKYLVKLGNAFATAVSPSPADVVCGAALLQEKAYKNKHLEVELLCIDMAIAGIDAQAWSLSKKNAKDYRNTFRPSFHAGKIAAACWNLRTDPRIESLSDAQRVVKQSEDIITAWGSFLRAWQSAAPRDLHSYKERSFWLDVADPNKAEIASLLTQELTPTKRVKSFMTAVL